MMDLELGMPCHSVKGQAIQGLKVGTSCFMGPACNKPLGQYGNQQPDVQLRTSAALASPQA